jgi:hypothetical protein
VFAAPFVAVAAIMAAPALAQAAPAEWYVNGVQISKPTAVTSQNVAGTESTLTTAELDVVCSTVKDTGTLYAGGEQTNPFEEGAGTDVDTVSFEGCKEERRGCPVAVEATHPETYLDTVEEGVYANLYLPEGWQTGNDVFTHLTLEGSCGGEKLTVTGEAPVVGITVAGSDVLSEEGELFVEGEPGRFAATTEQPGVTVG